MSRQLESLIRDHLIRIYLDMMQTELNSPERYVLIQDARNIKKQLSLGMAVAR